MPTIRPTTLRRPLRATAIRHRAQLPAFGPVTPPPSREPLHDFLVPNPRPDLTARDQSCAPR